MKGQKVVDYTKPMTGVIIQKGRVSWYLIKWANGEKRWTQLGTKIGIVRV